MPKFSRRKGKGRSFLAKKKIRNTRKIRNSRKIRGGNIDDAESMHSIYKDEVTFKWFSSIDDSKINIANNIAKARFHIENIIVKKTVELASAIFNEINNTNTPISKLLNLHQSEPLDELDENSLKLSRYHPRNDDDENFYLPENEDDANILQIILYNVIQKYYTAINNGNKIMNESSKEEDKFDRAISNNTLTKQTAQHAIEAIDNAKLNFININHANETTLYTVYKDELVLTTNEYIPDIVGAMNAIFNMFINISKPPSINNINVTPEEVGEEVYKALQDCKTETKDNVLTNISENKANLVYFGIYEIPVFFSEKTYKLFEYRLKLLHSLSKFEESYIKLVNLIMDLNSENDNAPSLGSGSVNEEIVKNLGSEKGSDEEGSDEEGSDEEGSVAGSGKGTSTAVGKGKGAQPPAKAAGSGNDSDKGKAAQPQAKVASPAAGAGAVTSASKGAAAGSGAQPPAKGAAAGSVAGTAASPAAGNGSGAGASKGKGHTKPKGTQIINL